MRLYTYLLAAGSLLAQSAEPDRLMAALKDRTIADQISRMKTDDHIKAYEAMTAHMKEGMLQANGTTAPEPLIDVSHVARAVTYMASLPLDANVQFMTVMATKMPYIGRG